jgi:hypothetical protein
VALEKYFPVFDLKSDGFPIVVRTSELEVRNHRSRLVNRTEPDSTSALREIDFLVISWGEGLVESSESLVQLAANENKRPRTEINVAPKIVSGRQGRVAAAVAAAASITPNDGPSFLQRAVEEHYLRANDADIVGALHRGKRGRKRARLKAGVVIEQENELSSC